MEKSLYGLPKPAPNTGIINVKDFGAKGDGVNNDTNALNSLIQRLPAGSTLYFPSGRYRLAAQVTVDKLMHFTGQYPLILPVGNHNGFRVTTGGTGSKFSFMRFQGEGKNTGSLTNQTAIFYQGAGYGSVVGCYFTAFPGAGVAFSSTETSAQLGGTISACSFVDNNFGISSLARGEYWVIDGCDVNANNTGLQMIGGNLLINCCNFNYCINGLVNDTGTNNAHGVINACQFNHCTTLGLSIKNTALGQTIANCHVFESPINIDTTTGVSFENCTLNAGNYTLTAALNTIFRNCVFGTNYGGTYTATTSEVAFLNCFNLDGTIAYDPKTFSKTSAKQNGLGTVTTTNATQTTAGIIDIPLNSAGRYTIEVIARNTANNDTWAATKVAVIQVDGTGTGAIVGAVADLFTPISDAGMATCAATADVNADTMRVRVTGIAATTIKWDYRITPFAT